jgi:hypothetical protein
MGNKDKKEALRANGTYNKRYSAVKKDKFLEGGFYDPMDIVQVKYEMLRDAEDTGRPVRESVKDFGFSRAAYYIIKENFERYGISALFPQKTGPRRPHKLTEELQNLIDGYRTLNPDMSVPEIVDAVFEEKGAAVSRRTIERYIYKKK